MINDPSQPKTRTKRRRRGRGEDQVPAAERFIKLGSSLVGSPSGALLSLAVGGPEGALAGSVAAPVVSWTLSEFVHRALSRREQARVSGVLGVAAQRLEELLESGETPREDGFFTEKPGDRSTAEEILEGVLLAAQREHQEKKIPFMGNFYANLAVTPGISPTHANQMLRLASEMSYTHLRLLVIFAYREHLGLRSRAYVEPGTSDKTFLPPIDISVLDEVKWLWTNGMLANLVPEQSDRLPATFGAVPANMTPISTGAYLFKLMDLNRIAEAELEPLIDILRWDGDVTPQEAQP
jgi:hypothetical protein